MWSAPQDTLIGGAAHDILQGGHGNDVLTGATGQDTLRGDSGAGGFAIIEVSESTFNVADVSIGTDSVGMSGGYLIDL